MPPKKRFNAFDDFPVEKHNVPEMAEQREEFVETTTPHVLSEPEPPKVERIERLRPSQMIPDRFQPRRLLPGSLREPFFSGKIDCYQAAEKWLQMAKHDPEWENETKPEKEGNVNPGIAGEVKALLAMGLSFGEHGQIKPITGSWVPATDGSFIFRIETGERRFWAACLQYVEHHMAEEPLLRVEVIENPTRYRQVIENQHAEPPSAVGRACEIAALILSELGIDPDPETSDEFDYFRQALQQALSGKMWDKLTEIMRINRTRIIQYKNILKLPTPLLELAHTHRVPERVLREVVAAPQSQWEMLLRAAIRGDATSDDVALMAQRPSALQKASQKERSETPPADPARAAMSAFKRFIAQMHNLDEYEQAGVLDELAGDFIVNGHADGVVNTMHELSRRIEIRQQNAARRRK